jgi:N-acetylmuramic acid 6-phosphate etherase
MKKFRRKGHLLTEQVNTNSANLDQLSSIELVDLFSTEDAQTLSISPGEP